MVHEFAFEVKVWTDSDEHAKQVMVERIGPDEDYGFEYSVDWFVLDADDKVNPAASARDKLARIREIAEDQMDLGRHDLSEILNIIDGRRA